MAGSQIYGLKYCSCLVLRQVMSAFERLCAMTPCLRLRRIQASDSIPGLVWQHIFVSPSAFSRRAVVSYWRKYVHEVLVNR